MRLVTWNCCRSTYAKASAAASTLGVDLAVLQEAPRPPLLPQGHLWFGPNPNSGLAAIPGPSSQVDGTDINPAAPWSIIPLQFHGLSSLKILLVWTRKEQGYIAGLDAALSHYADFLHAGPAVVLGDFNWNVPREDPSRSNAFSRVASRLKEEFGLVSAYHTWFKEPFGTETRPTHYYRWQRANPFHIDFCFVPGAAALRSVDVLDGAPWDALSDHRPLIVDFAL